MRSISEVKWSRKSQFTIIPSRNYDRYPGSDPNNFFTYPQLEANIGAAIALTDHDYLYTVIPNCRKEKIMGKKAVVISEAPLLSEEEIEFILQYVKEGGCPLYKRRYKPEACRKTAWHKNMWAIRKKILLIFHPQTMDRISLAKYIARTIP